MGRTNLLDGECALKSGGERDVRRKELVRRIRANIPDQDYVMFGGPQVARNHAWKSSRKFSKPFQTRLGIREQGGLKIWIKIAANPKGWSPAPSSIRTYPRRSSEAIGSLRGRC